MRSRIFLVTLIVTVWTTQSRLFAQPTSDEYRERMSVQVNAQMLITGETIYFTLTCLTPTGTPSSLSKLAYVELIDEFEKPILQTKVRLVDGLGSGSFFLTSSISTGNFSLIAYTKWMRNFDRSAVGNSLVTIVNPYRKSSTLLNQRVVKSVQPETKGKVSIDLAVHNAVVSTRQKVEIKIKNQGSTQLALSLSAKRISTGVVPSENEHGDETRVAAETTSKHLPDFRGETVSGLLTYKDKTPVIGRKLYLSAIGHSYVFHQSRTDSAGRFFFILKNLEGYTNLHFIADGLTAAQFDVKLDNDFFGEYSSFKPTPLYLDSATKREVTERNIYSQLENAYYRVKMKGDSSYVARRTFYGRPDKTYHLDDFTRFPLVEDVFREYIYEVAISKRNGSYFLQVINDRNSARFENQPLILVDGLPIDANVLVQYQPLLIKTIYVVTKSFVHDGVRYDGIVDIETYTGDAKDLPVERVIVNYVPWQKNETHYEPEYVDGNNLGRIPDFRVQLAWKPNVKLSAGEEKNFEFYTSDVTGDFVVQLLDQSGVVEEKHFTVK